ncbi:MAG: hypothetical protein JSU96_09930 [Acidobacteriota bacterium]|nr:MAG: hypothetical protein JSU96_09930 [Acidobacteriota bacterium]
MNRTAFLLFSLTLFLQPVWGNPDLIPLGLFGGDVRSLAAHPAQPDHVYLGTADGQIYRSENWGHQWQKLVPGLDRRDFVVDSLVFHPEDPDTIYAGGWELKSDRGALYRSHDGGATWTKLDLGIFESSIRAVAVSPANPHVIAVGITEGVLLSRDEGDTWERISRGFRSLHYVHSLAFDPQDENQLYVGTFRLAWKTSNLGQKWEPIHDGMNFDSDLFSLQVDQRDPNRVLAGACSGIYRSHNRGTLWAKLRNGLPSEAKRTRVVRFDPVETDILWAGTTEGLYQSLDGGDNWNSLLPGVVINAMVIDPRDNRNILLGTDDAGVLSSRDGGLTFLSSNDGFSHRQVSAVASRSAIAEEYFAAVVLDGSYGGFFSSNDKGKRWTPFNEGLGDARAGITTILPARNSAEVWLGTSGGIFVGTPHESEWARIPGSESLIVTGLDFADPKEQSVIVSAEQGVFRVTSQDLRAVQLTIPVYDRQVYSVYSTKDRSKTFIGTEMGVFLTEDQGKTWEIRVDGLPYTPVNSIRKIGDRLFCATRSGLYVSDNEGKKWQQAPGVFQIEITAIEQASADPSIILAADPVAGYLFLSVDQGYTWQPLNVGPIVSRVSSLSLTESGDVLAGTLAEGVYQIVTSNVEAGSAQPFVASR